MRTLTAKLLAPIMRRTGFRFSKYYRWGCSGRYRFVYALVDTVMANKLAGSKHEH